jgi:hypothetical protein
VFVFAAGTSAFVDSFPLDIVSASGSEAANGSTSVLVKAKLSVMPLAYFRK